MGVLERRIGLEWSQDSAVTKVEWSAVVMFVCVWQSFM